LQSLITSKTRIKLLIKFFLNSSTQGYLRGLSKEFDESTNGIRKELNSLTKAGYLKVSKNNSNKKLYKANKKHPLYDILHQIVLKELGLDHIVASVLDRMGGVNRIIVIGDYANGLDTGIIDVVVEGDALNTDYIETLSDKMKHKINRSVRFLLCSKYHDVGLELYNATKDGE